MPPLTFATLEQSSEPVFYGHQASTAVAHICARRTDARGAAGLSSLELFSMGLKATGCYLSRALSYRGADFALAPVPIDPVFRCVSDDERF